MAHESKLCCYHHGIYIGGGFVIDYNDDSKICRIRLTEFKDGTSLFRVSYRNIVKPLDPKTVIKKAKAALKTPTHFGQYTKVDNNCEHFATYCKFGSRFSQLADIVKTGAEVVETALPVVGAATGMKPSTVAVIKTTAEGVRVLADKARKAENNE